MNQLMDKIEHLIHFFGYSKTEGKEEFSHKGVSYKNYGFYDYKGKAKPSNSSAFMDFLSVNDKTLNMRIT